MSSDFDRLLRDTLETEALSYEPSGDGLTRIRSRVAARRARLRWLVPSVGLAAVAAAVAGVLVLPTLLPTPAPDRPPVAQSATPGPTTVTSVKPSAGSPTPAPAQLPDMVTVWPYASRREAAEKAPDDVASGRLPYLTDARATALAFVKDYVKVNGTLEVVRSGPLGPGIGVTLGIRNPNDQLIEVTTVFLVQAARGSDPPYVVVRADAPRLTVTDVSAGTGGTVSVTGRVVGVHQSVRASLLNGSGAEVAQGYDGAVGEERPWRVTLGTTGDPVPPGRYALVAQTASDANGYISELVVVAYHQP